jgi:hypothetical protein
MRRRRARRLRHACANILPIAFGTDETHDRSDERASMFVAKAVFSPAR